VIVFATFVSPYRERRDKTRKEISEVGSFYEIYVKCPLEVCMERDVKGLYKKALNGEIKGFTGVSDPYEEPLHPDLTIDTSKETICKSAERILDLFEKEGIV